MKGITAPGKDFEMSLVRRMTSYFSLDAHLHSNTFQLL